eukprot:SAG31_NODE_39085_length_291_cov_0.791667_1_plen_74_part_10
MPLLVAWQSDAFLTGAGHFVSVGPLNGSGGRSSLPRDWLPPPFPRMDRAQADAYLACQGSTVQFHGTTEFPKMY